MTKKIKQLAKDAASRVSKDDIEYNIEDGYVMMEMEMDKETVDTIKAISKLSKVSFDGVVSVLLAFEVVKNKQDEKAKKSSRKKKS